MGHERHSGRWPLRGKAASESTQLIGAQEATLCRISIVAAEPSAGEKRLNTVVASPWLSRARSPQRGFRFSCYVPVLSSKEAASATVP